MSSRVVPRGPWTGKLNWNLRATYRGETYVPFHVYVQLDNTHQPSARDFRQFTQLPAELQLQIFCYCDSAVLFQLMHVSSATRRKAEKLFWSCPDLWWKVDGDWLLAGGFSGHIYYAIDFLASAKQIEVEFSDLGSFSHNAWEDGERQYAKPPPDHVRDQQIHNFWQTLQRRFPNATDVILSEWTADEAGTPPPAGLRITAGKCPTRIRTSVSCLQKVAKYPRQETRSLWRPRYPSSNQLGAWEVVTLDWTRTSVLPPHKKFSGPVGAFCRIGHDKYQNYCMQSAIRVLRIYAIEAYYLQNRQSPSACPFPGCGLQFALPGQWAIHAIDARHDEGIDLPSKQLRSLFQDHSARLARIQQQCTDAMEGLRSEWGKEGSTQRTEAEHAFVSQLQHDPLYTHEYPPRDSSIWRRYQREMNNEFSWR
ncbi:hypothetical protein CC86DRAFT_374124 [Ophiobolus disseminans]|uniref:Uncharacterized protein n=1 Tax=Ophiobolus disseminans TaxID=1469910 RepID=A0A6A6ZKD0_9PLEO|nr:hypothetical protein CC86DRAFT_374124 [Ophiobolus disseminans]